MLKIRSIFPIIAFSGGFYGFYFFLLIVYASGLGFNSRLFTIPYRAGFLAFSLIFLVYKMISKRSFTRLGPLWIPLLTFWFLYFLQIARDGYLDPVYHGIDGLRFSSNDPHDLAQCIHILATDKNRANQYAENACTKVTEKFSIENHMQLLQNKFLTLLND